MINQASWGIWIWIALSVMFIGPVMRMMFGGRNAHWMGDWDSKKSRIKRNDVARLETAIGERDAVIEDLQLRLSEMESRLDFTERLLSERTQATR